MPLNIDVENLINQLKTRPNVTDQQAIVASIFLLRIDVDIETIGERTDFVQRRDPPFNLLVSYDDGNPSDEDGDFRFVLIAPSGNILNLAEEELPEEVGPHALDMSLNVCDHDPHIAYPFHTVVYEHAAWTDQVVAAMSLMDYMDN